VDYVPQKITVTGDACAAVHRNLGDNVCPGSSRQVQVTKGNLSTKGLWFSGIKPFTIRSRSDPPVPKPGETRAWKSIFKRR
jgi:hypothetical protein